MGNTLRQIFAVSGTYFLSGGRLGMGGRSRLAAKAGGCWRTLFRPRRYGVFFRALGCGAIPSFGNGAAAVGVDLPSWRLYLITRERNSFEIHTIWVHWRARIYKHFSAGRPSHRVASF